MAVVEFRFSFSVFMVTNTMWFLLNILTVNLIFGQVQSIAGWGKNDVLILSTIRALFNTIFWIFLFPNLTRFHNLVRKGELDFVLTKPVNSRFWVSTRYFEFDNVIRLFVVLAFVNYYLGLIGHQVSLLDIASFLFFFGMGIAIFYNFCFMLTTANIWFVNIFNLENIFDSMQGVAQYPPTVFTGGIKVAMVFLIPTIFISFFPTLALLGKENWTMFVLAIAFLIITSVLSQKLWTFALRNYTSASS